MSHGTLYLIPNLLGDENPDLVLPKQVIELACGLRHFVVEDIRSARRYLRRLDRSFPIDDCMFSELNRHTPVAEVPALTQPLLQGHDVGVISEAGCPCVADPGALLVRAAHENNLRVVPLTGPSSIILSVMASGMNGQSFAFVGYLPIVKEERMRALKRLESRVHSERQTQVFIETPYRNEALMDDLLQMLGADTRVCVACDVTLATEFIATHTIKTWRKMVQSNANTLPANWSKRPTIFAIGD